MRPHGVMTQALSLLRERRNESDVARQRGERPVLDYELAAIAKALVVPVQTLFE